MICNIKSLGRVHIGDTVTVPGDDAAAAAARLSRRRSGWSIAGCIRPTARTSKSCATRSTKLRINDPSFEFEPETSDALGFGFRCGFLGLLHMEIIQQRLEGEADLDLVQTAPNVTYRNPHHATARRCEIHNPQEVPDAGEIEEFRQPIVRVNFVLPVE